MSTLPRSLIDAAAEASYLAWHHGIPFEDQAPDVRDEYFRGGRAAVVAVLETLAAYCDPVSIGPDSTEQKLLTNADLRRLSEAVRGVGEKGTEA